jgi:hypothetical protein
LQSHGSPLSALSSVDLLPEKIFGTEEVPEYILSDSSTEEEDATPEQMIKPPAAPPHSAFEAQLAGHHRPLQRRT